MTDDPDLDLDRLAEVHWDVRDECDRLYVTELARRVHGVVGDCGRCHDDFLEMFFSAMNEARAMRGLPPLEWPP